MTVPDLTVYQSGVNQVSGDQLNTFTQSATTVVNLRTLVGVSGMEVNLQGFTVPNDGGQGQFYWNTTSTATDDSGVTTVVPNGVTQGAWIRLGSGNTSTLVNSVTNSDGSIVVSPTSGNVVVSLGSYNANTALANATASTAQPTGVALTVSTLLGRGPTGNIAAIPFSQVANFNAITGCLPSSITGSSTTAAITISSGIATDSTNIINIVGAGYSWAAANGNAANGTDAIGSTLSNSSTYHMYLFQGTSGTCSYASTNLNPGGPTGYTTYKRRIFSFNTNSSGAPIPYVAIETEGGSLLAWLSTQLLDQNGVSLTTTQAALIVTVPTGIKVQWIGRFNSSSSNINLILTSGDETNVAPASGAGSWSAAPGFDFTNSGTFENGGQNGSFLTTNTSGQIAGRATGNATLYLVTRGFKDWRRV